MGLHMLTTPACRGPPRSRTRLGHVAHLGCNTQPDFVGQDSQVSAEPVLIALWQQGEYFIDFVREDGVWKWKDFRWYVNFRSPFDAGWVKRPIIGNLSVVAKLMPGCPEPDGPSEYHPFSPGDHSVSARSASSLRALSTKNLRVVRACLEPSQVWQACRCSPAAAVKLVYWFFPFSR